jgi:hypothetical protein
MMWNDLWLDNNPFFSGALMHGSNFARSGEIEKIFKN